MMNEPDQGSETIVASIARNIRQLRQRQGLSLNELAERSGVSKSTLSVLEGNRGNPNIETLFAIAAALGIPFGQLMEQRTERIRLIKKGEGTPVLTQDEAIQCTLLTTRSRRGAFELYRMQIEPNAARKAGSHHLGTIEHVFVIRGSLTVGPVDEAHEATAGDLVSFYADGDHLYETANKAVHALVLVDYA